MRFVLSLLILFTLTGLQAQSQKELVQSLKRDLEDYRRFTLAANFDSSFQFMSPRMFDIVPFDSLKATMLQSMDNEYMKIELTGLDYTLLKKLKVKKAGNYFWALVPYNGSMRMELKGEEDFKKLLIPIMKSQFGSENVKMEGASTMLLTLKNKNLIAVKEPGAKRWYMLEDKRKEKGGGSEMQIQIYETVIPEDVRKAIDGN
ncbi:MAG TPA: hypothetical protein VK168_20155 [Saprospiraceae bacterium]|nr:hypothetical protein [Saprospiraceae bacterium]